MVNYGYSPPYTDNRDRILEEIAMLQYDLPRHLPSADELPDSDDTPVYKELQELIPGLLKAIFPI